MPKPHESIRIFKNPWLERLTHVHPITPLVIWAPFTLFLLTRSFSHDHLSLGTVVGASLAGFVFWTLAEYILHRYIFHLSGESAVVRRFQFLIHGLHHDDPVDPTRLVMPPAAAVILAVILYSLFRSVLGPLTVDPFFAGFVAGYLCYDYIHYGIHHFNPTSRVGKYIKRHHMLHHFSSHDARWGVSSPIWDYVFRTLPAAPPAPERRARPAGNAKAKASLRAAPGASSSASRSFEASSAGAHGASLQVKS